MKTKSKQKQNEMSQLWMYRPAGVTVLLVFDICVVVRVEGGRAGAR